ncbi:MAG: hypothetical protein GKR91_06030 [Pseudomonadales bacterium]|nr:hypothetical protein [Pseudomonadales bacterium]
MRTLIAAVLFCFSTSILAQVAAVNVFEPLPGKAPLVIQYMNEAKAIHQAMGVGVATSFDGSGIYRYAVLVENWEAYGNFVDALGTSAPWALFQARIASNPAATQIDNLRLNGRSVIESVVGPGSATHVFVWELGPGVTMNESIEAAMGAKEIHERTGVDGISVYATGGTHMYYLMHFNNMSSWGRFQDQPNMEFNQYMGGLAVENGGQLPSVIVDDFILTAF